MTSSSDYELIHGQLYVTKDESQPELLGLGTKVIRGATYMQSPTLVGNDTTFENIEAPFMIGPIKNTDSQIPWICDSDIKFIEQWEVSPCGSTGKGAEKYGEKLAHPYSLVVRAGDHITKNKKCKEIYKKRPEGPPPKGGDEEFVITPSEAAAMFIGDVDIYGYTRIKDKLSVVEKADFNSSVVIKGDVVTGSDITLSGTLNASGEVKSNCGGHVLSAKKNFDIPHPTKEGWRLTHTCVEGPEASVYIRGRVRNKTEIELPEYWKNLVDINTITVNLTPIGAHQDVIVKRWDSEKVYLQAKAGMPIDCFYYIMAERKDTEKLIPEYEGTIEDYPGDNSQRSIAGYHYDVKDA